jgi:hypothetical protein
MEMLYNSENYAVVRIDVRPESARTDALEGEGGKFGRGGYEIVDKFARKEIFLQGAMADSFKQGVDALIQTAPSEEEIDAYIERFTVLMQHALTLH